MTYAQLDDRFDDHPKYEELDFRMEHYGLQACAITYCNRGLTDGRLPKSWVLKKFGKRGVAVAEQFVSWGLWTASERTYEIVGFLDHNPSREEVEARRARVHEARVRAGHAGGLRSGALRRSKPEANGKQTGSNDEANAKQEDEAKRSPLRSDPLRSDEREDARAPEPEPVGLRPIPEGYEPTQRHREAFDTVAMNTGARIDFATEWAKFVATAREKSKVSADWHASWSKWLLDAAAFAKRDALRQRSGGNAPAPPREPPKYREIPPIQRPARAGGTT